MDNAFFDPSFMNSTFMGFSLSSGIELWQPVLLFVIGVAIYSIFVFRFYRFLARKDIFASEKKGRAKLFLEYLLFSPAVIFAWFFVMMIMMGVISVDLGPTQLLFTSAAYVSVVRVASYYNEDLSRDLAKLIPFALLAIFIIDFYEVSFATITELFVNLPVLWRLMVYYFIFVVGLEFILRLLSHGKRKATSSKSRLNPFTPNEIKP